MSDVVKRRLFSRVVIWDTKGGTIFDLPTRYVLAGANPVKNEEYAQLATGEKTPISRSSSVQIPISAKELDLMAEVIQRTSCPVKAAFIGPDGTDTWVWLEPTRLQITDPEIESGQTANKVLDLDSSVFYPAIWEGSDLTSGIPWQGTEDYENPETGRVEMRMRGEKNIRKGYRGPIWEIASSDATGRTIDLVGNTSGITDSNPAIIRFEFPVWGAKIKLDAPAGYQINDATLRVLNFRGSTLVSDGSGDNATLQIPDEGWFVEIEVTDTDARPRLRVTETNGGTDYNGRPVLYVGKYTPDCNKVDDPDFDPLPDPNIPPDWLQKEDVRTAKASEPPVWENREDLVLDALSLDNTAPEWDNKEKLEVSSSLVPDDVPPTWEDREDLYTGGEVDYDRGVDHYTAENTQKVYSHEGGFSSFDYPDGSNYNIINDDIADGQVEIDGVEDKTFIARNDGIYVQETSSYILDTSGSSNKEVRGLAIDPIRQNVFFTYNDAFGVYRTSYDGSDGENQIVTSIDAGYQLAFEPNYNYLFAASRPNNEILRFETYADTLNKTLIIDGTNFSGKVYQEIKVCTSLEVIVWQHDDYSEMTLQRTGYDGGNTLGLVTKVANIEVDPWLFGVADKEKVVVTVSKVDGGYSSITFYEIKAVNEDYAPSDFTINNAHTGNRVSTSKDYTTDNTAPEWDSKASLEYDPNS